MNLRVRCCILGGTKPKKAGNNGGASKFIILREVLQNLFDDGCLISAEISNILCVSERRVYQRMKEYNLSKGNFAEIPNDDLDSNLANLIWEFSSCGEVILRELLVGYGFKGNFWGKICNELIKQEVSQRIRKYYSDVFTTCKARAIFDTNYKLVRWYFIIIEVVDGFSRLPVALWCAGNNKACAILQWKLSNMMASRVD